MRFLRSNSTTVTNNNVSTYTTTVEVCSTDSTTFDNNTEDARYEFEMKPNVDNPVVETDAASAVMTSVATAAAPQSKTATKRTSTPTLGSALLMGRRRKENAAASNSSASSVGTRDSAVMDLSDIKDREETSGEVEMKLSDYPVVVMDATVVSAAALPPSKTTTKRTTTPMSSSRLMGRRWKEKENGAATITCTATVENGAPDSAALDLSNIEETSGVHEMKPNDNTMAVMDTTAVTTAPSPSKTSKRTSTPTLSSALMMGRRRKEKEDVNSDTPRRRRRARSLTSWASINHRKENRRDNTASNINPAINDSDKNNKNKNEGDQRRYSITSDSSGNAPRKDNPSNLNDDKNDKNNNDDGLMTPPDVPPSRNSGTGRRGNRPTRRRRWSIGVTSGESDEDGGQTSNPTTSTNKKKVEDGGQNGIPAAAKNKNNGSRRRRRGSSVSKSSNRTIQTAASSDSSMQQPSPLPQAIQETGHQTTLEPATEVQLANASSASTTNTDEPGKNYSVLVADGSDADSRSPPSELDLPDLGNKAKTTLITQEDGKNMDTKQEHENQQKKAEREREEEEQRAASAALMREEEASLERFRKMMQRDDLTTIEQINVLYALGRLSAKMGRYEEALEYHQAELELTQELVDETTKQRTAGAVVVTATTKTTTGNQDNEEPEDEDCGDEEETTGDDDGGSELLLGRDAVARVLDGMARIAKQGLANAELALSYHRASFQIRRSLQQRILEEAKSCPRCIVLNEGDGDKAPQTQQRSLPQLPGRRPHPPPNKSSTADPPPRSLCPLHARALADTRRAMEETRQNMGRILFEQGQVNQAVQLITKIAPPCVEPAPPILQRGGTAAPASSF